MEKIRSSNIEVFRIFLMFVIVVHHFVLYSVEPFHENSAVVDALKCVSHFGVIAFVLISGYFGIKLNVEKFFRICFQVLFFSIGLYLLAVLLNENVYFSFKEFFQNSLVFTSKHAYWFIVVYLQLFLLSPLLNCAIDNLDKKKLIYIICVFAFFVFYMSFIRHSPYSLDGKDIVNFSMIYLLGGFLRKYDIMSCFSKKFKFCVIALFAILSILCICIVLLPKLLSDWIYFIFYSYNSPGIIVLALLFFVLFFFWKVDNNLLLNKVAASVFAVYLLHENVYFHSMIYNDVFFENIDKNSVGLLFVWIMLKTVLIFLVAFILDYVRVFVYSLIKGLFFKK